MKTDEGSPGRKPKLFWVMQDNRSGVYQVAERVLRYRRVSEFRYAAIVTRNRCDHRDWRTPRLAPRSADEELRFDYSLPVENVYHVFQRLRRFVPDEPGVIVSNDWIELGMISLLGCEQKLVQILHGDWDYYYDLAAMHEPFIDAFVGCSRTITERLRERLPERRAQIHHLPYGIDPPERFAQPSFEGPLRLLFVGRLADQKGVMDLPRIARELARRGVEVEWTIIGEGPDRDRLTKEFEGIERFTILPWQAPERLADRRIGFDVFVLPTRAEGFPLTLLESMSVGLVPVVSRIESGVPELVYPGETGYSPPMGDVAAFASDIERLAQDRESLDRMSKAARELVRRRHDGRERAAAYHDLFSELVAAGRPSHRPAGGCHYLSRLDRPWIPNAIVKSYRYGMRKLKGKPAAW